MPDKSSKNLGFRLDLGEPWASDLVDFCAANYKGSQTEVIREALNELIHGRLSREPVMRIRFDEARKRRLATLAQRVSNSEIDP
ncbi:MAG TPA: hypothetical protein VN838_07050 [Bradyrhizobium sp.]|nr:hypothetical protein [Bradyrhizobium sp.]